MEIKLKSSGIVFNTFVGIFSILVLLMVFSIIKASTFSHKENLNTVDSAQFKSPIEQVIQVNILNGTEQSGVANKLQNLIRSKGFDVVEVGNFNGKIETTFIIDRLGNKRNALKLAKSLSIPDSLVFTQIDSTLYLHCSIVIGKDYPKLK